MMLSELVKRLQAAIDERGDMPAKVFAGDRLADIKKVNAELFTAPSGQLPATERIAILEWA